MSVLRNEVNPILSELKKGDKSRERALQRELIEKTYYHLKQIALHYAFDRSEWEDILMDAYLRAFTYIDTFKRWQDGYNWLCKIVENVTIDHNKKFRKTEPLDGIAIETVFHLDPNMETKNSLDAEINKLSETDQLILYYRFYEDWTLDEIAKELDTCKSNVYKRIDKLITDLKIILEKE